MSPEADGLWAHFEKTAQRLPEHPAICAEAGRISYAELLDRAADTGDRLERSLGNRRIVAIYADLAPDTVIALLAASRAKAVAVLLDRSHPADFTASVLQETAPALVLESDGGAPSITQTGLVRPPVREEAGIRDLENVAAIVWTSGSTGRPKGVAISERGLMRDAQDRIRAYNLSPRDRVAWTSSPSYAGSIQDICFTLLSGGTLLPGSLKGRSLQVVSEWLCREQVSFFRPPVSYYRQWIQSLRASDSFPALRTVSLGGQVVSWEDLAAFQSFFPEGRTIVHRYAVTECNLVAQALFRSGSIAIDKGPVPLGFPPKGKRVLILGDDGESLSPGETGEVAIIGTSLSPGYWGRPGLTAERFRDLPGGERMYLTGDLGRIRADGQLELLGRRDGQLKIRGFRVEPAQVERAIRDLPGVEDAAVVPWASSERQEEKVLLAYVKPVTGKTLESDSLRRALVDLLPAFMVPSRFLFLPDMPRNEAGKLDWKALPDPGTSRPELTGRFIPPEGCLEKKLAGIWEEILEVQPVGREDDFFDLGGNSLAAVRLFSRLEADSGRKIPLSDLLRARTVRSMACLLEEPIREEMAHRKCLIPIRVEGDRPCLFLVHGGGGHVLCFARLAALLSGYDVYAFQPLGLNKFQMPVFSVREMAKRYASELREVQPAGPYRIMGYSFGGAVAFELALQVQATGGEVVFLGMLDRSTPARSRKKNRQENSASALLDHGLTRAKYRVRKVLARVLVRWGVPVPFMEKIFKISVRDMSRDYLPPGVFNGSLAVFQTEERQMDGIDPASEKGWGPYVRGEISVYPIPGIHSTLLEEPHVYRLAELLGTALGGECAGK